MKPTLLILAAGMASRYGSMKQTEGFGPAGETIMDYSIFDAIRNGFGKVVFVIREDFAENFKASFEPKLKGKIETEYVYQDLTKFTAPGDIPEGRKKPWGTGHAILCAKDAIKEPFAVINADDFYGSDAYAKAYNFLANDCNTGTWCIIGYRLDKTLSDHGTVSRGVCKVDDNGSLIEVVERTKIYPENGNVVYEENNTKTEVPGNSSVSMNFWGFHPTMFEKTEKMFAEFVKQNRHDIKAEFFIPLLADSFVKEGNKIKVIPTESDWFGVTYKEDAPIVKQNINDLISAGQYPDNLWTQK